jgi:flagellar M-ring protein FliF
MVMEPQGRDDDLVSVGAVQGGIQRGWINSVSELIQREPDDALKVVKSWLAEGV